jgi:queuine tRNA-ribosyltransferase
MAAGGATSVGPGAPLPAGFRLTIEAVCPDTGARACRLETPHGPVHTPCFMPVGTRGGVKALLPAQLRDAGAQVVLANTYHLALRPGSDVVAELGGLHAFTGWDGPILTDSGGFQILSLSDIRTLDDDGVTFRSVYDGSSERFTPERALAEQEALGADLIMCLDDVPAAGASPDRLDEAVTRTSRWADRQAAARTRPDQMLLAITQGGLDRDLRARSLADLAAIGFDAYAIGGLSVGEDRTETMAATADLAADLPADRLRYFMGIGDPDGFVGAVARGIDIADCVLPTRLARHGTVLVPGGRLNVRNAAYARDARPLQAGCPCPACTGFSRGYLRHLVTNGEQLAATLLSAHNVRFLCDLAAGARAAIIAGTFSAWLAGREAPDH